MVPVVGPTSHRRSRKELKKVQLRNRAKHILSHKVP